MPDEVVKVKRAYHRKPKPVDSPKIQPNGSKAQAEIDNRIAQAIMDRATAIENVSKLTYWQDRLMRINQEIESLIGFQQRLSGQPAGSMAVPPSVVTGFSHTESIPAGISSIPAPRGPKPTTPNMGPEVIREGGFS